MKDPHTLIDILVKCQGVQEMIATAEVRACSAKYGIESLDRYWQKDLREWYANRIAINTAIIARLQSYYSNLIYKALPDLSNTTTNSNIVEPHSINV